jgi:hypothetical protein
MLRTSRNLPVRSGFLLPAALHLELFEQPASFTEFFNTLIVFLGIWVVEPVQEWSDARRSEESPRSVRGRYVRRDSEATTPQMAIHGQAPRLVNRGRLR